MKAAYCVLMMTVMFAGLSANACKYQKDGKTQALSQEQSMRTVDNVYPKDIRAKSLRQGDSTAAK